MTYDQWEASVPSAIREDPVWRIKAYRLALFLSDVAWSDGCELLKHRMGAEIGDQVLRCTSRISACIIEGYSRGTAKDRARFYGYALGSTREARDWYYKGRWLLKADVVAHRLELTTQISKLLTTMATNEQRTGKRVARRAEHDA